MDFYAAWIALHPLLIFLLLPALAAGGALLLWHLAGGLPSPRRRILFCCGVAAVSLLIFVLLAVALREEGGMVAFDQALAAQLGMTMSLPLLWVLSWFTYLGDRNWLIVVAVVITLVLLLRRRYKLAVGFASATGGGGVLNMALKHAFQRVRPEYVHAYGSVEGWSFPSGHASAAMAVYGMVCYLLLRMASSRKRPLYLAGVAALIMAIGVSRVLLQVHYATDVLAGFAVSSAWLALCVAATERWLARR